MVSLYLATRNVTRKKERSILTIIGVLLAVGSFISLLSIAEGMYRRVQAELNGRSVHVYITPQDAMPLPLGPLGGVGNTTETIPDAVVQALIHLQNVEAAQPIWHFQQMESGRSVIVWGLDPQAFDAFLPNLRMPTGKLPTTNYEIVVGQALARELSVTEGGRLSLAGHQYFVTGIFSGGGGMQDYFCYVTPSAAREITGKGPQEVWLKVKEPEGRDVTAADINKDPRFQGFTARSNEEYLGAANDYINYAWLVQFAVAAISVLIAMTAAMNTMLMSTYERLKEFATLRAIGGSRVTVVGMILAESLILSTIGGVCGVVLGIMGSQLLDTAVVTLFKLTFPVASITFSLVLEAVALSGLVGLVGAIIPCFLVYRMNIITGLRQE